MSISNKVLYALECNHAAPAPPTLVSGVLLCAWCRKPKGIVGVIEYEWHANCNMCAFSRWAGLSKHNAELFANAHVHKSPAHTVTVEYVKNPTAVGTAHKFAAWKARTPNHA